MPAHPTQHVIWTLALLVATVAIMAAVRDHVIRRRLRATALALAAVALLHEAIVHLPAVAQFQYSVPIERLLGAFAVINGGIALAFNPWLREARVDRTPAIVQDFLLIALFGGVAVFFLHEHVDVTVAATAAVIGFALQDQLGNVFAGLAIQIEKPFRVGHWITVASFEGRVVEVTWRATKIRTKAGNLVIVPNSTIAREAINNYSEPIAPTRLFVDVGAAYEAPPNDVREAMMAAMRRVKRVLTEPAPDVLLADFGSSAITYRARFWILDFAEDDLTRDEVRTAIYYEFGRRRIEIPWPIQVQYERDLPSGEPPGRREGFARAIAAVPVLASLEAEAHLALAQAADERLYGDRETIVREGDPGGSMFIIRHGRAVVSVGADSREVAAIDAGGYFGEMSLLTGEPRTATVTARGDCDLLEISADAFRAYVKSHPEVIDHLAQAAADRRRMLDERRAAHVSAPHAEHASLVQRMRHFFGLSSGGIA